MADLIEAKAVRTSVRIDLGEAIPLSTPFRVHIEPTNFCNFKCRFCPTGSPELLKSVGRKNEKMTLSFFKEVVDQLKEFPDKVKSLLLHKDGEPLMHPEFAEMYACVKQADVAENIRLYTNASLLTPPMTDKLLKAGLDWICLSIEGVCAEKYFDLTGHKLDYDNFLSNIKYLHDKKGKNCFVLAKIVNAGLTEAEKQKFVRDFSPVCDGCTIENLHDWSASKGCDFTLGGGDKSVDGTPFTEKKVCPMPFISLAVNCNGTVSVCCVDWSRQTVVGDLKKETLRQVWNGEKMRAFRLMHLNGERRRNKACAACKFLMTLPDNIDGARGKIISKIRADASGE